MSPLDTSMRARPAPYFFLGALGITVGISVGLILQSSHTRRQRRRKPARKQWTSSPLETQLPALSAEKIAALPYPPNVLPGAREVLTPYGTIHVFEWGPEDGEKVLLMAGISTPCLCQSDLADELVAQGYRVMLFDYFGRGYSDLPLEVPFDLRLYTSQVLLVLASSPLSWTGNESFHLMGYSLGGALAAAFAGYFPHMLRSLTLTAAGGLIRPSHVSWQSKLLYSEGLLPEWILRVLVKARLTAPVPPAGTESVGEREMVELDPDVTARQQERRHQNSDVNGGGAFDSAVLSRQRPGVTVSHVMAWQVRQHQGFVPAFMGTVRRAPIYDSQEEWLRLGEALRARRENAQLPGLRGGRVLMVLGQTDPVIVKEELVHDATRLLSEEGFEAVVLDCGHEVAISRGADVAQIATEFWSRKAVQ